LAPTVNRVTITETGAHQPLFLTDRRGRGRLRFRLVGRLCLELVDEAVHVVVVVGEREGEAEVELPAADTEQSQHGGNASVNMRTTHTHVASKSAIALHSVISVHRQCR
jgi:hypothetical protein